MPYVPGVVSGNVRRGWDGGDQIALVRQNEIGPLAKPPAGIIVVDGAPFSHLLIGIRGLGVPTVIAGEAQAARLTEGMAVVLDGGSGIVTTDLAGTSLPALRPPTPVAGQPVLTLDGEAVYLRASVRSANAARQAVSFGAAGIGLVRSEFLVPESGVLPDVDFYERTLRAICELAAPLGVTIRLLDLAPDKRPPWLPPIDGVASALGLQGARLFNVAPVGGVFRAQLEAIGQLAAGFDLRVLIPYLVRYEELAYWRDDIARWLPGSVTIGGMTETPSGVLDIANWLNAGDFLAIGCNDLMQCLFGADRDLPAVHRYLDPYAPVLFRLLRQAAHRAGTRLARVQLCGLLPQLRGVLPVLLGLGYRAFSVESTLIPYLAQTVRATDAGSAQGLAEQVCAAVETRQVLEVLGLSPLSCQSFLDAQS